MERQIEMQFPEYVIEDAQGLRSLIVEIFFFDMPVANNTKEASINAQCSRQEFLSCLHDLNRWNKERERGKHDRRKQDASRKEN